MAKACKLVFLVMIAVGSFAPQLLAQDPIRIAFIDPMSGTNSATGANGFAQFQFAIDYLVNSRGGVLGGREFVVEAYDSKTSSREALIQLKRAIGEGIVFIAQGNSSSVAHALNDQIKKNNRRNPDQRVLYLNYAAVDPALTNEKCSFWQFRFDAHADIKMKALVDAIAKNEDIHSIYIIGQDYSFGKAVAAAAERFLAERRPDIEILGNELHPMDRVKDFSPYVTKIKSANPDAIITGNWGGDMVGLARAIASAGITVPIYTYYGAFDGITATLGAQGRDKIRLVHEGHYNPAPTEELAEYHRAFKERYPDYDLSNPRIFNAVQMLARAIDAAGSTDPLAVALELEGMEMTSLGGDPLYMRPDDHQMFQPLQISIHTDVGIVFDADNSGFGLVTESTISLEDTIVPTSCDMQRPS